MKKTAIIIFIKNPDLGRVKKRLAQTIGDEIALEVYHQMLAHARQITKALSVDKFLYYDREAVTNDAWPDDVYQKKLQTGATMSLRVDAAFKELFNLGYEHVVIIGSDCLDLDERIIRLAFRQLDHFDTVLGPTRDGGSYLLGMAEYLPEVFKVAGWGTANLSAELLKAIQHGKRTCFKLSELSSITTVEDLTEDLKYLVK
ncbi:TIGR04282 family arsenosugar biosynthesis glycosyltransferase [Mucilaginibacter sp. HMF5004]|uniref:TIGR04282 family arsenosugar biosynthesis glycosyltransferase n=1 Tax=Mucilaginibacter rivuli TaxID=2857527 RepID=UPI001C5DE33E|nr:TIGR04282 family arsenosugar biosynthesis glycosyltransferase [Mucilaginibacter rivuli]MBW4891663.1 TIGR04282 family arsenosugar biosynthesis glycosyltransferase [Mucilaginibacter rivuli]